MHKVTGNLWILPAEAKVIPTNGMYTRRSDMVFRAHMGAGLAKQAADRWPKFPYVLGERLATTGNRLYVFQVPPALRIAVGCTTLVTFPTKNDWRDPSLLKLIERSATELDRAHVQNGWTEVLLPQVGCGLGGLQWSDVEPILDRHLDYHFSVVEQE